MNFGAWQMVFSISFDLYTIKLLCCGTGRIYFRTIICTYNGPATPIYLQHGGMSIRIVKTQFYQHQITIYLSIRNKIPFAFHH